MGKKKSFEFVTDPVESAQKAGLRYVTDNEPGIVRKKKKERFIYRDFLGNSIHDEKTLDRIKVLRIPPAWTDVWICAYENGHLQATGRDSKGRKQYRYHPKWREVRDETKYDRMIAFGHALPKIRKRTDEDLNLPGLQKNKVLATIVQLLEKTLIRVGNDEYAKENKSFGLTTLRDKHVDIHGNTVEFEFKGKSGVEHMIELNDKRLAKIVKNCRDIPGYELFQYIDENKQKQVIDSADVNAYLKEITGEDFTAKDFRTWYGTVLAAEALKAFEEVDSEAKAKKNITRAIESVSKQLGNTKAICRKCYIHPAIIDSYMNGSLIENLQTRIKETLSDAISELEPEEAAVVVFLQEKLEQKVV